MNHPPGGGAPRPGQQGGNFGSGLGRLCPSASTTRRASRITQRGLRPAACPLRAHGRDAPRQFSGENAPSSLCFSAARAQTIIGHAECCFAWPRRPGLPRPPSRTYVRACCALQQQEWHAGRRRSLAAEPLLCSPRCRTTSARVPSYVLSQEAAAAILVVPRPSPRLPDSSALPYGMSPVWDESRVTRVSQVGPGEPLPLVLPHTMFLAE